MVTKLLILMSGGQKGSVLRCAIESSQEIIYYLSKNASFAASNKLSLDSLSADSFDASDRVKNWSRKGSAESTKSSQKTNNDGGFNRSLVTLDINDSTSPVQCPRHDRHRPSSTSSNRNEVLSEDGSISVSYQSVLISISERLAVLVQKISRTMLSQSDTAPLKFKRAIVLQSAVQIVDLLHGFAWLIVRASAALQNLLPNQDRLITVSEHIVWNMMEYFVVLKQVLRHWKKLADPLSSNRFSLSFTDKSPPPPQITSSDQTQSKFHQGRTHLNEATKKLIDAFMLYLDRVQRTEILLKVHSSQQNFDSPMKAAESKLDLNVALSKCTSLRDSLNPSTNSQVKLRSHSIPSIFLPKFQFQHPRTLFDALFPSDQIRRPESGSFNGSCIISVYWEVKKCAETGSRFSSLSDSLGMVGDEENINRHHPPASIPTISDTIAKKLLLGKAALPRPYENVLGRLELLSALSPEFNFSVVDAASRNPFNDTLSQLHNVSLMQEHKLGKFSLCCLIFSSNARHCSIVQITHGFHHPPSPTSVQVEKV